MYKKIIETHISVYQSDELSPEYQSLINNAKEKLTYAYAPYSGFQVGAAVLLENGEIFAASNQENAAYPSGLCAERVAIFFANAQYPDVAVKAIAVAAFTNGHFLNSPIPPCGSCRQVLLETESRFDKNIEILLYGTSSIYKIDSAKQLLPVSFEKNSLDG